MTIYVSSYWICRGTNALSLSHLEQFSWANMLDDIDRFIDDVVWSNIYLTKTMSSIYIQNSSLVSGWSMIKKNCRDGLIIDSAYFYLRHQYHYQSLLSNSEYTIRASGATWRKAPVMRRSTSEKKRDRVFLTQTLLSCHILLVILIALCLLQELKHSSRMSHRIEYLCLSKHFLKTQWVVLERVICSGRRDI